MKKSYYYVLVGISFLLLITFLTLIWKSSHCLSDQECQSVYGRGSLCDQATKTCLLPAKTLTTSSPMGLTVAENPLTQLQLQIDALQSSIDGLTQQVNQLEQGDFQTNSQLANLETRLESLSSELEELKGKDLDTVGVGLAALQKELKNTTEEVNQLKQSSQTRFYTYLIIFLIIVAVFGGIIYYVKSSKKEVSPETPPIPREIHQYVTKKIKEGKKFPQIKEELIKAGWSNEDIEWAYKETLKHNYKKFLQKQEPEALKTALPSRDAQKMKIISIVIISVILLGGILFLISRTTGQAIRYEKLVGGKVGGYAGEVTYTLECTPPHILAPDEQSCCRDNNNNTICDYLEKEQKTAPKEVVQEGEKCQDNRGCSSGLCLNQQCLTLSSLYKKPLDSCSKVCNFYVLSIITSDQETYSIKPREGSYTAAGGIDWMVMSAPDHCKEEPALVPIKVTKKKDGEVLSEEVITLRENQESKAFTHPDLPKLAFTLKMDHIYELCAENSNELNILMEKQKQLLPPITVKK